MAYQNRNYRRRPAQNHEAQIVESIFQGIGQILKFLFGSRKSGSKNLARLAEIRQHWDGVESHLLHENTRALAVSEADKLLDAALQVSGVAGETMGERLKSSEGHFSPALYNQVWEAHKLRNHLAHELGSGVSSSEAQAAVAAFRSALYELNVLA